MNYIKISKQIVRDSEINPW